MSGAEPAPVDEHEYYGRFEDQPHVTIELTYSQWVEAAKEALGYKVGPPVAWEYHGDTLYLWGEQLDQSVLDDLSAACHALKDEAAMMEMYDAAEDASTVESKFARAEVQQP